MKSSCLATALLLLSLSLSSVVSAQTAPYQTYVINTYGGEALLPIVRQQLNNSSDGGNATTYQGKLVLRTSAADY